MLISINNVKSVRCYLTTWQRVVMFITIKIIFHSPTCSICPHSKVYKLSSIEFDARHSNIKTKTRSVLAPCRFNSFCKVITTADVFIFSKCQTCYYTTFQDPAEEPQVLFVPRKCAPPSCGITHGREGIIPGLH